MRTRVRLVLQCRISVENLFLVLWKHQNFRLCLWRTSDTELRQQQKVSVQTEIQSSPEDGGRTNSEAWMGEVGGYLLSLSHVVGGNKTHIIIIPHGRLINVIICHSGFCIVVVIVSLCVSFHLRAHFVCLCLFMLCLSLSWGFGLINALKRSQRPADGSATRKCSLCVCVFPWAVNSRNIHLHWLHRHTHT